MVARLATAHLALLLAAPAATAAPLLLGTASSGTVLAAGVARDGNALDRTAIFEVLCGGKSVRDPKLREHLWRVAGSLAAKSWTPPQVTVRVVVRPR